jgi:1,2-diacylglycerol 3-beta-glucosyltransferase
VASALLKALALLFLVPSVVLFLYNITLALLSLAFRRTPSTPCKNAHFLRFAVVVPAHNEEALIESTMESCLAIEYPTDKYDIVVIADNCTDATAAIVRSRGIQCLERHDETKIGKGHALKFAFDQLMTKDYDAFVVLDADCTIDPNCLEIFANEIAAGQWVLQANDCVSNPDASVISYAVAVGNAIENQLYYRTKSALGLVVLLRGTGMVFSRYALARCPWGAFSLVEDKGYSISLYRAGLRVKLLPNVAVRSPFPENIGQLKAQRLRWAGGSTQLTMASALKNLMEGVGKRKVLYVDLALTLVSQSKPLQLASVGILYWLSFLGVLVTHDRFFEVLFGFSNVLAFGYAVYIFWGVLELGLSPRRFVLLLQSPPVLAALALIALTSIPGPSVRSWRRTPRE